MSCTPHARVWKMMRCAAVDHGSEGGPLSMTQFVLYAMKTMKNVATVSNTIARSRIELFIFRSSWWPCPGNVVWFHSSSCQRSWSNILVSKPRCMDYDRSVSPPRELAKKKRALPRRQPSNTMRGSSSSTRGMKESFLMWPLLTRDNYFEWEMLMQCNYEALEIWEVIDHGTNLKRLQDCQAISALLRSVLERCGSQHGTQWRWCV